MLFDVLIYFYEFAGESGEIASGESRHNSLRLQESQTKSLVIEVVSSQSKVSVSVDGATVSYPQKNRFKKNMFSKLLMGLTRRNLRGPRGGRICLGPRLAPCRMGTG